MKQQSTFTLTQDGETLIFEGNEYSCMTDYEKCKPKPGKDWQGNIIEDTETFFDWCKNSYPYTTAQKEGRHTPGEMEICGYYLSEGDVKTWPELKGQNLKVKFRINNGKLLGMMFGYATNRKEAEANAQRIVTAWNEYDTLKADNKQLHDQLNSESDYQHLLKAENEKLKEQLEQSLLLYKNQTETIVKRDEQNRGLLEALKACKVGIMGILPAKVNIDNPVQMAAYNAYHYANTTINQVTGNS